MKENLGQEHVKRGPLSFQGKLGTIFLAIPGKRTVFFCFDPIFHPSLPKIWLSHLNKNYIFEICDNLLGYLLEKFHNVTLTILNLVAI